MAAYQEKQGDLLAFLASCGKGTPTTLCAGLTRGRELRGSRLRSCSHQRETNNHETKPTKARVQEWAK